MAGVISSRSESFSKLRLLWCHHRGIHEASALAFRIVEKKAVSVSEKSLDVIFT
jgi:pyrimidine operon attenuation protein/uracil phosphoribosyltransferase